MEFVESCPNLKSNDGLIPPQTSLDSRIKDSRPVAILVNIFKTVNSEILFRSCTCLEQIEKELFHLELSRLVISGIIYQPFELNCVIPVGLPAFVFRA